VWTLEGIVRFERSNSSNTAFTRASLFLEYELLSKILLGLRSQSLF